MWAQATYNHSTLRDTLPVMQKHKQLAKGHDDLRQDAVMQQFFSLVNTLLNSNATTAARQLRIAVYRVVVFTSASGTLLLLLTRCPC